MQQVLMGTCTLDIREKNKNGYSPVFIMNARIIPMINFSLKHEDTRTFYILIDDIEMAKKLRDKKCEIVNVVGTSPMEKKNISFSTDSYVEMEAALFSEGRAPYLKTVNVVVKGA